MGTGTVTNFRAWGIGLAAFLLALGVPAYLALRGDRPAVRATDSSVVKQSDGAAIRSEQLPPSLPTGQRAQRPLAGLKFNTQPLNGRAYSIAQSFDAPPGDAAEVVARLLPLAEAGDEVAAFAIYRKVDTCRVDLLMARDSAPSTDLDALIPAECRSIPIEQWRTYTSRWLEASAERGFVPAQLLYSSNPEAVVGNGMEMLSAPDAVASYRRKAMTYLQRAAATGNVDALQRLARAYGVGVLTKRDPALAYAYNAAADTAMQGAIEPELAQAVRQQYAQGLSSSDIERATQQGRKIYETCCSP